MDAVTHDASDSVAMDEAPKALVVDDSLSQRLLLSQMLFEEGLNVTPAGDGIEAIEAFERERPDIILMDIQMPRMDGVEAAKIIREKLGDHYIPIIFVTGGASNKYLNECVKVGGDDFITKPFNPIALSAKIKSFLRIKTLYQKQHDQRRELEAFQNAADIEHEIAASLYKNMIASGFSETPNVRYDLSPMAMFNGDILLTAYTPANKLNVLLGDFTGHGITASVASVPAAEIFYGMTSKGFGIREIAEEINQKLKRLLPSNLFLAATLLSLDPQNSNLSIITCGLPDHFLFSTQTGEIETISAANLPLGIVGNRDLNIQEKHFEVSSHHRLVMFSDGVIETENAMGEQFGFNGVKACLSTSKDCFDGIMQALAYHRGGLSQQDDITLVEVSCDMSPENWNAREKSAKKVQSEASEWRYAATFYADTLKRFNPVPMVVNALMDIQGLEPYRESIFLVVTELFVNSLEHGLLQLDSSLKHDASGFARYFELKQNRIDQLDQGYIKILFHHRPEGDGGILKIRIQDTGAGFDETNVFSDLDNNQKMSGRGLTLVRQICESLTYTNEGRQATAVFRWPINEDSAQL